MSSPAGTTTRDNEPQLTTATLIAMSVAAGTAVANLYYNQPLLAEIARAFDVSVEHVGWVPMLTQIGYAAGMFLFVPLGDVTERRKLIVLMSAASVVALIGTALAPNFALMALSSFAVGTASIVPQLLVPFAANLSAPDRRGRAVGTVMSGLLIGILLARTVSGIIGQHLGWRAMFWIASAVMAVLTVWLVSALPRSEPNSRMSYGELLGTLWPIVRDEPVLREAALTGAVLFGAFSVFWATLVFLIEGPPYYYGAQMAGLFGLVGVVGASVAPMAGRYADRRSPRLAVAAGVVVTIASYLLLLGFARHMWGLVLGIILLDAGVQGGHVSNQTRIYALSPELHNRVNTVYMVTYFLGGSLGSALGTWAWQHWNWPGVTAVGLGLLGLGAMRLMLPAPPKKER